MSSLDIQKILAELSSNAVKNIENTSVKNNTKSIQDRISENEKKQLDLEEKAKKLQDGQDKHDKEIISLKALIIILITILTGTVIVWFYDTFFVYQNIKSDYIEQTKDSQKQIELFSKDIDYIKEKNSELEKYISKEVDLQISKRIIELDLNKDPK